MSNVNRDANAESSPLELRLEVTKDLGNLRLELPKAFYDRRSVAECYLDGNVVLHLHWSTGKNGFCATWKKSDDNRTDDACKVPVFVGIAQFAKSGYPVASTQRLQPLDSCDVVRGQGV